MFSNGPRNQTTNGTGSTNNNGQKPKGEQPVEQKPEPEKQPSFDYGKWWNELPNHNKMDLVGTCVAFFALFTVSEIINSGALWWSCLFLLFVVLPFKAFQFSQSKEKVGLTFGLPTISCLNVYIIAMLALVYSIYVPTHTFSSDGAKATVLLLFVFGGITAIGALEKRPGPELFKVLRWALLGATALAIIVEVF